MIIGAIGATEPLTEPEKEWIAAQIQQIIGQENPTLALTTLLGWEPRVSFDEGLTRAIDWYRR